MNHEIYMNARRAILKTLAKRRKWGGAHTPYKRIFANYPKDDRGKKEVKKAAEDLTREGKLMIKQTTEDDHVSLNPRLIREIMKEIGECNI